MAKREEPRPEMVARMARYLGCSGTHKGPNGELMPCSSHEELMRISDRAEPKKKKADDPNRKKRRRVGRNVAGYEPLGERGVLSIESLPGGGLVSGKSAFGEKAQPTLGQRFRQQQTASQQAGRSPSSGASYDPNARDSDGDGTVQEGTEFARRANSQRSQRRTGSADTAERQIQQRQNRNRPVPPPAKPVEEGNIDLSKRKPVELADGALATIRSISVNINGLEVLLPTIGPKGEDWDPDTDAGLDAAIGHYERTGQHLGKFRTVDDAVAYGDWLHDREAERIASPTNTKSANNMLILLEYGEKAEAYTKPELRERIKKRIMAGSRGGKPGQWSARKAQLLALEYRRAGGGYRGGKKKPQRSLDKWTSEEWTTSDGKPAIREGGTTRYLPKKAWRRLTPAQRAATNRKKRRGSQSGSQFVPNTERARNAGRQARGASKSIVIGRAKPRVGDPDVFASPDAARLRARTLGCIGISRRETPDGTTVWMPCTNMSDYRRRTGVGVQAERDRDRAERRLIGRLRREMKTSEDCGCSDPDLSGFLLGAFGDDRKALGRAVRKRIGAGRRKPPLRRVAFDSGAEDADGDGLVQEGTIHQRPAKPQKPADKPTRLSREVLTRDFASSGKKKKKPKLTDAQRNQLMAREAAARQETPTDSPDGPPPPSRVRNVFTERQERLKSEFGDVLTKSDAIQAMGKAFPNATVDFELDDTLTPSQRGAIHTLLDLSLTHPNTAEQLRFFGDVRRGSRDYAEMVKKNTEANHSFRVRTDLTRDDGSFVFDQGIDVRESISANADRVRPLIRDHVKRGRNTTGMTYVVKREDGDLNDEDLDELYASYLMAHEFAHAWHYASMRPKELDDKDPVVQISAFFGIPQQEMQDKWDLYLAASFQDFPNDSDAQRSKRVSKAIFLELDARAGDDPTNAKRHQWMKDGLSQGNYGNLPRDSRRISKYAETNPREAFAEEFSVEYLLKGFQNIENSRSGDMRKLFAEASKKKSADENWWKDVLARMKPPKEWPSLSDEPFVVDTTCPGFHQ